MNNKKYLFLSCSVFCFMTMPAGIASAQDQFTSSMNFESSTGQYNWHTTAWGQCSQITGQPYCNEGEQRRTRSCRDVEGNTVADSNCDHTAPPAVRRLCELPDCTWQPVACTTPPPPPPGGSSPPPGGSSGDGASDANGNGTVDSADMGGVGGGDGGGKVLCGHYYARGILPARVYQGDVAYAQRHVSDNTKRGYWFWAVPLTQYLNNNPGGLVEKLIQPLVFGWAQEMAYRTGYTNNGSFIGKSLLSALPAMSLLGKFVETKDPTQLASEQQAKMIVDNYNRMKSA